MTPADQYRKQAADCDARARNETSLMIQAEWADLAHYYRRFAEQADRNSQTNADYEPPLDRPIAQQQQQAQPKSDNAGLSALSLGSIWDWFRSHSF